MFPADPVGFTFVHDLYYLYFRDSRGEGSLPESCPPPGFVGFFFSRSHYLRLFTERFNCAAGHKIYIDTLMLAPASVPQVAAPRRPLNTQPSFGPALSEDPVLRSFQPSPLLSTTICQLPNMPVTIHPSPEKTIKNTDLIVMLVASFCYRPLAAGFLSA